MEISQYGKVAVLMGGTSNERDISFESGRAVLAALHKKNIVAEAFDPKNDDLNQLQYFDRAFICLHGKDGEDGEIQKILELSDGKDHSEAQGRSDIIAGFGELWSAQLLSAYLNKLISSNESNFIDSREILYLNEKNLGDSVDWIKSREKFSSLIASSPSSIYVITGFIASKYDGLPTNLGRNGSDYSAAIFASLFNATF